MNIDILSEQIYFYNNGLKRHASTFGGLLSVILAIFTLSFSGYSFSELITRTTTTSTTTIGYINDAGILPFDQLGMFHFIRFVKIENGQDREPPGKNIIQHVGTWRSISGHVIGQYFYDKCDWNYDVVGLKHLLDKSKIEKSLCIRSMKNSTTGEIIINNEENKGRFVYPRISRGLESKTLFEQVEFYTIAALECVDPNECAEEKIRREYFDSSAYYFSIIDNNFDPSNYSYPINRFVNSISGRISYYSVLSNNLNINPVKISTSDNWIFTIYEDTSSFFLYQNEKVLRLRKMKSFIILIFGLKTIQHFIKEVIKKFKMFLQVFAVSLILFFI
jgi:hypothetical protein